MPQQEANYRKQEKEGKGDKTHHYFGLVDDHALGLPEFVEPQMAPVISKLACSEGANWKPEDLLKHLKFEILKVRKGANSKLEYYVHFDGFDKRYDRWMDEVSVNQEKPPELSLQKEFLSPRSTMSSLAQHSFTPTKSLLGFDCSQ